MERRDFIKMAAAGIVAASAPWWLGKKASAEEAERTTPAKETEKTAKPRLKIIFHYGRHESADDAENIAEVISRVKPHVYCPENAYFKESRKEEYASYRRTWRRIAGAGMPLGEKNMAGINQFTWKEMGVLEKNRVPETVLEINPDEEAEMMEDEYEKHKKFEKASVYAFMKGDPEQALDFFSEHMTRFAEVQKKREATIVANAKQLRDRLLEEYPHLAKEKEIRVLVKLGSMHTPIFKKLKAQGADVERYFDFSPVVFTHEAEIMRGITFGTKRTYGKDDYARAFLGSLLELRLPTGRRTLKMAAARVLVKKLNYGDFRELSRRAKKSGSIDAPLKQFLAERKIRIPENEKEMNELLRKHYPKMKPGLWRAKAPTRERI